MLKFTPATLFHPSIVKKPTPKAQTHCYTNFPKLQHSTTNKPFPISSCCKNADSSFKASLSIYPSQIFSVVVENDLILLKHNEVVGVIKHVVHHNDGLMEILCELGLRKFKISRNEVINLTSLNEESKEKLWGIRTLVECKGKDLVKILREMDDMVKAHEDLNCNSMYNLVAAGLFDHEMKIIVNCYVTCSNLKTPRHKIYMEVRMKVLSEIEKVRSKSSNKVKVHSK